MNSNVGLDLSTPHFNWFANYSNQNYTYGFNIIVIMTLLPPPPPRTKH